MVASHPQTGPEREDLCTSKVEARIREEHGEQSVASLGMVVEFRRKTSPFVLFLFPILPLPEAIQAAILTLTP